MITMKNKEKESDYTPCRYMVSIEVYDNETCKLIVGEGFNTEHKWYAADALQEAADKLNK
ncbi:MAG: hypothetical protein GY820_38560 [Gammaproteobacteria bacterium]|nr:hypothetical protein [Gammaproteobacteria bacterium]